ncbi:MAG TPA: hypothetical protein PLF05_05215 [Thermoclostridium sp.]|nr:hypothetical protein [Thermoclostridium sp.]
MGSIEKKISDYIDDLNAGKKPDSHESADESPEFEELAGIVRIVRCLKEPEMPGADYPKKLVAAVTPGQTHTTVSKKKKKHGLPGRPPRRQCLFWHCCLISCFPLPGAPT